MRKTSYLMLARVLLALCVTAAPALAQVTSIRLDTPLPLPDAFDPTSIAIRLPANVVELGGGKPPTLAAPTPTPAIPPPEIYFRDKGGPRINLKCEVRPLRNFAGGVVAGGIELFNFRSEDGLHPVSLVRGSTDDGGAAVPPVPAGQVRIYSIVWDDGRLKDQIDLPLPVFAAALVGAPSANPPSVIAVQESDREVVLTPTGIKQRELLDLLRAKPELVTVTYKFGRNDPATNFDEKPDSVGDTPALPGRVVVNLQGSPPSRPEEYKIEFALPASAVRPLLETGFAIPPDVAEVTAEITINKPPPSTERPKTEFFFETTFTSIVNATTRDRSNVGLFGLHLKPVVGLRFFNTDKPGRRPQWVALRPLFDADVDTQPIKDSQAPNRIVFGADLEWGIDAGLQDRGDMDLIQQYVFLNGVRYDSDRDFKTQTLYWQTEFVPRFVDFVQTRDQRLREVRFPGGKKDPDKVRHFPLVSQYHVRPSVGYQLGGTIKRGDSDSDNISRLFVKLSTGIEFKRLLLFTFDDTYYFLQDAERRRNRNYLETRLDFNTGTLFNVDLGGLQSAVTFKFQRGDLPPRFKPVNAFSVGFKLYR